MSKREAPKGWQYINKTQAAKVWADKGKRLVMHANNINNFHVFGGWRLGHEPSAEAREERTFTDYVANFMFYQDKELGTYPVFLVEA